MTLVEFNDLDIEKKKENLRRCCGAEKWVKEMISVFPVDNLNKLLFAAEIKWNNCSEDDWRQAFKHHPKIGNINSLKEKYNTTKTWAEGEQSGVAKANDNILKQLSEGNNEYEKKFGCIFIVCATGKSAEEMLQLLQSRLKNKPEKEIKIAAAEQLKITKLRLQKLFT